MQNEIEQTQLTKTDSKNRYEKLGMKTTKGNFFVGFLLIIILLITYWLASDQWKVHVEKGKMLAYLQEKYGKEFVVEDIYTSRKGLGFPLEVNAKVHPVDDKELVFAVNKDLEGDSSDEKYYVENYLYDFWSKQAKQNVQAYFNTHSIDISSFNVRVSIIHGGTDIAVNQTLTLSEALKRYNKKIVYCIAAGENGQFSDEVRLKYANQVMQILGFFRENNCIENPELSYGVYVEHNKNMQVSYGVDLSSEQIKKISKAEEIASLFKKRNY